MYIVFILFAVMIGVWLLSRGWFWCGLGYVFEGVIECIGDISDNADFFD